MIIIPCKTLTPSIIAAVVTTGGITIIIRRLKVVQLRYKVGASHTTEFLFYAAALFRLIPEEELALCKFLALSLCAVHWLKRVRVITCIPCLSTNRHRRGREVLYLLQLEVKALGLNCKFSHILLMAAGMTAYKVRYELLSQSSLLVNALEYFCKLLELLERRLTHKLKHIVRCVFGGNLKTSAHMLCYQFLCVLLRSLVVFLVLAAIQKKVVTNTAADEALLYSFQCIYGMIYFKQLAMVCIQVGTNVRIDA